MNRLDEGRWTNSVTIVIVQGQIFMNAFTGLIQMVEKRKCNEGVWMKA